MVRLLILIFLICSQNCYCQDSIGVSEKIKRVGGKWEIDGRKLNATELEREVYKTLMQYHSTRDIKDGEL